MTQISSSPAKTTYRTHFPKVGGVLYEVIGTSVAAPQFSALLADLEQIDGSGALPGVGRLSNVNPTLYSYKEKHFSQEYSWL